MRQHTILVAIFNHSLVFVIRIVIPTIDTRCLVKPINDFGHNLAHFDLSSFSRRLQGSGCYKSFCFSWVWKLGLFLVFSKSMEFHTFGSSFWEIYHTLTFLAYFFSLDSQLWTSSSCGFSYHDIMIHIDLRMGVSLWWFVSWFLLVLILICRRSKLLHEAL